MTDQTATKALPSFIVIGDWLVSQTGECNCAPTDYNQHEPHCGLEPVAMVSEIITAFSGDRGEASDGSHTFNELYAHRHALFITIARLRPDLGWRAHHHDDGTMFPDYFVAGLRLPAGQVNYHLPLTHWAELDCLPVFDRAPAWDGHTPDDAIARLLAWRPENAWLAVPHQMTRIEP